MSNTIDGFDKRLVDIKQPILRKMLKTIALTLSLATAILVGAGTLTASDWKNTVVPIFDSGAFTKSSRFFYAGDFQAAKDQIRLEIKRMQSTDVANKPGTKDQKNNGGSVDSSKRFLGSMFYAITEYHLGNFKSCLRILAAAGKPQSDYIDYLYFYRALCYRGLGQDKKFLVNVKRSYQAKGFLRPYALFEKALFHYERKQNSLAVKWLQIYSEKFPKGPHRWRVKQMLGSMKRIQSKKPASSEDAEKPFSTSGLQPMAVAGSPYYYKNHSFISQPHFWVIDLGLSTSVRTEKQPEIDSGRKGIVKDSSTSFNNIFDSLTFGLGPYSLGEDRLFIGYKYSHDWQTTNERIENYNEDPSDLQYFPYRPDLLQRSHEFFLDYQMPITNRSRSGVFFRITYSKIGSNLFEGPEDTEINQSLPIGEQRLLVPYVGYNLLDSLWLDAYLYFFKNLNDDEPRFSHKTFSADEGKLSSGLSITYSNNPYAFDLRARLYQYQVIFNEIWFDYTRTGFTVEAEKDLLYGLGVEGGFIYHQDSYDVSVPVIGNCARNNSTVTLAGDVNECRREEKTLAYYLRGTWTHPQDGYRLFAQYEVLDRTNTDQPLYDLSEQGLAFGVIWAFPGVESTEDQNRFLGHRDHNLSL